MFRCSDACSAQFSGRQEATPPEAPDKDVERSPVDEAILTALAEFPFPFLFLFPFPFSPVREFSRMICLPRSTMHPHSHSHPHSHPHRYQHITQSFRFTGQHLQWSPTFDGETEANSRFRWQSNYCRSSRCKARTSGTTLSSWTSCRFVYSMNMI
jgi:hypothetical protein